jgi:uncharacterized protein YqjF (DUF2071 family)
MSAPDQPSHRPYPPPSTPWAGKMEWDDLLFEHWRVPFEWLRPHIPKALELETFDGSAWLAVVPFQMNGVRTRGMPALPWLSSFPELNVRTYVKFEDRPGVWFFSLDADQPVAVRTARALFHLNYVDADMKCRREGDEVIYTSKRANAKPGEAEYRGRYRPLPGEIDGPPGSLPYFLTARYCLYSADGEGRIYRAEVDHAPWPLQPATATIEVDTMTRPLGFDLPKDEPLRWFSRHLEVHGWAPERVL